MTTDRFQLKGDQPLKRTYDEKTRTLHVEQVRSASVPAGGGEITQEDWDSIFSDCKEEEVDDKEEGDNDGSGLQGTTGPEGDAPEGRGDGDEGEGDSDPEDQALDPDGSDHVPD